MFAFISKLILALVCFLAAKNYRASPDSTGDGSRGGRFGMRIPFALHGRARQLGLAAAACFLVWAVVGTSVVWVTQGNIATLKRVYFGSSLKPGRIVALDGELGPQARILTAGFHFEAFISLMYEIDELAVFSVPNGQCAILSAKDGLAAKSASAFAAPWPEETKLRMINDATHFMTEGRGERGPQTGCLLPGSYTINPFLWETPRLINATRVEQGTVGVVKSSVRADVDFGSFKRSAPADNTLRVLTKDQLPQESASALLVPVGAIGVWEEALPNGLYYVNTDAYRITMVPTVAQVYEYKGGYTRTVVDVTIDDKSQVVDKLRDPVKVEVPESAADSAIFTKPEGWDVAQELRVLAQVSPKLAPFVVASLGLTAANAGQIIEDRVVTPIIRSVVRDVLGGAQIPFRYARARLDADGRPILSDKGEPLVEMASEFRAVRVLDLLDQRAPIEEAIEERAQPEALKEGVTINEVRLAESSIPAELLIARKREQLAQQLTKAWAQEEVAQAQRQKTENAKAQANQQSTLVEAQIYAAAMLQRSEGRKTEGEGEKSYLSSVAEGQRLQAEAMGQDNALRLQMFQQMLKTLSDIAEKKPEILLAALQNPQKFVPTVSVSGSSAEGAAAVFGQMFRDNDGKSRSGN
jgi:regulator of protease activity HflC (stomatin/prohibitin superfamily)